MTVNSGLLESTRPQSVSAYYKGNGGSVPGPQSSVRCALRARYEVELSGW